MGVKSATVHVLMVCAFVAIKNSPVVPARRAVQLCIDASTMAYFRHRTVDRYANHVDRGSSRWRKTFGNLSMSVLHFSSVLFRHFLVRQFLVRHLPVRQFPPLRLRPSFSSPTLSTPAISSGSLSCDFVRHLPVLHFPVLQIQPNHGKLPAL